jgi:enoyl-CoA hydratase/carnithine racemase
MLIELTQRNRVAVLKMNNPKKLNALSTDFMSEMYEAVSGIEQKANVLVIVGVDKAFAAGVNVSEIHSHSYESAYLQNFIDAKWECIFDVKIPVIAAISGYALGGGFELALMCDIIIASPKAMFGFPEVNLGIMPGMGGTQMLTRVVGPKIASEIIMTGRFIPADEAWRLGIVSHVTDSEGNVLDRALALAETIAEKSVMSTRKIKESIRMSQETGLRNGINCERDMFRSLFSTSFKQKGVEDFLNKKK